MSNQTCIQRILPSLRRHLATLALATALTGTVYADNSAFVITYTHQFGTIDLDTGVFTQVNADLTFQGVGLGVASGHLFTAYGGWLYQINTSTGVATQLAYPSGITYEALGSTRRGLYALDDAFILYLLNPNTGGAAPIGPTGIPPGVISGVLGLSTNSTTLYAAGDTVLYSINTCTGKATALSTIATGLTALVQEGGFLYAGDTSVDPTIYKVNPTTGAYTFASNASGNPPPTAFYGLAPYIPANSPATPDAPQPEEPAGQCPLQ